MTKINRHKAIKELIKTNNIESQDALLNILIDNGFDITQATLSRDIKELRIVKTPMIDGTYAYRLPETTDIGFGEETLPAFFKFISIDFSGQLAIAKTRPGYAMAIAAEIDKKASEYILGTVAGDDTILLIPKENMNRKQIIESLSQFID